LTNINRLRMFDGMKIGYGYRRKKTDLEAAGADEVRIDLERTRPKRDELLEFGVRDGDELIVLYFRDLGGSPVADRVWREKFEAKGVTVVECRPDKPAKRIGRPLLVNWSVEQTAMVRTLWLSVGSEIARLHRVADFCGHEVGKGLLTGRFGTPSNPKR
jgi:hypothetical protein